MVFMAPFEYSDVKANKFKSLLLLCHNRDQSNFFLYFIDIIYETDIGKVSAPLFQVYSLHTHDKYVVYQPKHPMEFIKAYQSPSSENGLYVCNIAKLDQMRSRDPIMIAEHFFQTKSTFGLCVPYSFILNFYYDFSKKYCDLTNTNSYPELIESMVKDFNDMLRYEKKIKTQITNQIRAATKHINDTSSSSSD